MSSPRYVDVLIIGSGAAGASCALRLAPSGAAIAVMSKGSLLSGSTYWAQGGIAAALAADDSPQQHAADTLVAGAGLCDPDVVAQITQQAPDMIAWLSAQGMPLHRDTQQQYHLTQEGGHKKRRIVHAADATGKALATTLIRQLQQHPNIRTISHTIAIDCIIQDGACHGVYALNSQTGEVETWLARSIVLATGGANTIYGYTTNTNCSSGDGMAIAYRAGCNLSHMEFNQFHPTCLYHPQVKTFLLSEAMRGEGAYLTNQDGERFMLQYHPDAELAPRDIVARAIDHEMKRSGALHVWLDISHQPRAQIIDQFPTIYQRCLQLGIDITQQKIPVIPAAHYSCGGVVADLNGLTQRPQLYAIGEVAYTGLHGANRMASNSLLECLIMGHRAAAHIQSQLAETPTPNHAPAWNASHAGPSEEKMIIRHHWQAIRQLMWNYVGIVRSHSRLQHAHTQLLIHQQEIQRYYQRCVVTQELLELRNLVQVALIMVTSAQTRTHNVGLHYNVDCV